MGKFSVKWKTDVQKLTHKAFDKVSQELKTATAKKVERTCGEISIYTHEALPTYFSKQSRAAHHDPFSLLPSAKPENHQKSFL
jgi:hypothetical protein